MPRPKPGEVRLRVAGLYYDQNFPLKDLIALVGTVKFPGYASTGKPTILELMEAAYAKPGPNVKSFGYSLERRKLSQGTYDGKDVLSVVSIAAEYEKSISPSLSGKTRLAGLYQLIELPIPNGVVAWQYYVYREGKSVSQYETTTNTGFSPAEANGPTPPGFEAFDAFELKEQDEVIWRMVAIQRTPIELA
ncbi:MAG: hypothetical protein ACRCZF_02920 [Gemmataceae bacterium]